MKKFFGAAGLALLMQTVSAQTDDRGGWVEDIAKIRVVEEQLDSLLSNRIFDYHAIDSLIKTLTLNPYDMSDAQGFLSINYEDMLYSIRKDSAIDTEKLNFFINNISKEELRNTEENFTNNIIWEKTSAFIYDYSNAGISVYNDRLSIDKEIQKRKQVKDTLYVTASSVYTKLRNINQQTQVTGLSDGLKQQYKNRYKEACMYRYDAVISALYRKEIDLFANTIGAKLRLDPVDDSPYTLTNPSENIPLVESNYQRSDTNTINNAYLQEGSREERNEKRIDIDISFYLTNYNRRSTSGWEFLFSGDQENYRKTQQVLVFIDSLFDQKIPKEAKGGLKFWRENFIKDKLNQAFQEHFDQSKKQRPRNSQPSEQEIQLIFDDLIKQIEDDAVYKQLQEKKFIDPQSDPKKYIQEGPIKTKISRYIKTGKTGCGCECNPPAPEPAI